MSAPYPLGENFDQAASAAPPAVSHAGVRIPPPERRAGIWDTAVPRTPLCAADPLVWLLGAHGGAAVSTLTASLAWAGDTGRAWPSGEHGDSPLVAIVARSNASGLRAAHDRISEHLAGINPRPIQVLGLIVVADTDRKLGRPLEREVERVSQLFPQVWRLGWVEPWRHLLPEQLPAWSPTSQLPPDRLRRSDARVTPVPPVRVLHEELLDAAAAVLRTPEDSTDQ